MTARQAAREEVLERIFGSHNDLRRADHTDTVELFVRTGVGIFPHRTGPTMYWYGFALDERDARELRGLILAFVGPSWTDWTGLSADLDRRHPTEAAVAVVAKGPVFRLTASTASDAGEVTRSCRLLIDLLNRRPPVPTLIIRPRHRLLADLELALLAGEGGEAAALIDELAASGALSAINIRFLKLRRLGAIGAYRALLDDPDLPDLLRRRRPRVISALIARALRHEYIDPEVARWANGDADAPRRLVRKFADLDAAYGAVLDDAVLETQPDVSPAVAMHYLLLGQPVDALRVAANADEPARSLLTELIDGRDAGPASTQVPAQQIDLPAPVLEDGPAALPPESPDWAEAVGNGDWVAILRLAPTRPTDQATIEWAVRAGYNLDTTEAAATVLALLDAADPATLETAREDRLFRGAEASLRELTSPEVAPSELGPAGSYGQLFQRIADVPERANAVSWAERGRFEWPHAELADPELASVLVDGIERCSRNQASLAAGLGALAHFVEWLDAARDVEIPGAVLMAALDLAIYSGENSASHDTLVLQLLEQVLTVSNNPDVLHQRLREILELWLVAAAPRRLDWPLAVIDVAVDSYGTDPMITEFLLSVLASSSPWKERIEPAQVAVIRSLARELGCRDIDELLPGEGSNPETDPLSRLQRQLIGIYTLMIGAGARARHIIEGRAPGSVVETNHDTVATARLRTLATRADAMIVAHQHAQHAATDAIVAARGRDRIIAAIGKGSVGIVRALERWALER